MPDRAKEIAQAVQALGVQALDIQANSAEASEVVAAVEQTVEKLGGIDILVNNAGVAQMAPIDDFTLVDFDRIFAINVRAVFVATQAAVKHMQEGGRIINIGSTNAERVPFAGASVYAMSKSALQGLVQGLARDLGPRGITINNVQPGPIATDMNPPEREFAEMLKKQLALPRYGTVEEVAGMVAYLAGSEAAYITGANLMIDGGFSA
ncbi:MAG: SDR family oxidoreductase [Nostoc sp.]